MEKPVILTGDRTTGPLHLGHYAGSLKNRVALQNSHDQYLLLADMQALTDNGQNPTKVRDAVVEVALDYLASGIDPEKSTICLQSGLPALSELTMLYLNLVTVSRLERNPTIRDEIRARGFDRDVPAGFLCYPASQAADITGFKAKLVPVGADQAPMIELTNEVVRKINRLAGCAVLPEAEAMIPAAGRLPGSDGRSKMSKSAGNSLRLSASPDEIRTYINAMFTDPDHLRVDDPGKVEGNVVFTYLDAFDDAPDEVQDLKARYRKGGLGDRKIKSRLEEILQEILTPIRNRRAEISSDIPYVLDIIRSGTERANDLTQRTKREVAGAIGLFQI